jgi:IstB-like ATP binding protein
MTTLTLIGVADRHQHKPFGRWAEVFGDEVVAAAMIDRLVHHAEVIALKGDSYRLKDRDLGRVPASSNTKTEYQQPRRGSTRHLPKRREDWGAVHTTRGQADAAP